MLDEVHVTDLSPGMVEAAQANAERLGFTVEGRVADAERIPYDDNTFDVVVGPRGDPPHPRRRAGHRARCCGCSGPAAASSSPASRPASANRYARSARPAHLEGDHGGDPLPPLREHWASEQEELDESSRAAALEAVVDLHTFDPDELARTALRAGAVGVGPRPRS